MQVRSFSFLVLNVMGALRVSFVAEPDFNLADAIAPFQPMAMKVRMVALFCILFTLGSSYIFSWA